MSENLKSLSDSYLYQKYPKYQTLMMDAIMKDPTLDKTTDSFADVIYDVKRAKVISESLAKILSSTNVILLDCEIPLPRSLKIFASRDPKSKDGGIKIFIDTTNVIEKDEKSGKYTVDDVKLLSYLMDAAVTMIYHKAPSTILKRSELISTATTAFSKLFTRFFMSKWDKIFELYSSINTLPNVVRCFLVSLLSLSASFCFWRISDVGANSLIYV